MELQSPESDPHPVADDSLAARSRIERFRRVDLGDRLARRRSSASVWVVRVVVLAVLVAVGALWWWARAPVPRRVDRSRIDVSGEPVQEPIDDARRIDWRHDGEHVSLAPLARYRIAARVVGTARYRFGWQADLVPWDVALVWGRVATPEVLSHVHFHQSGRWVYYVFGGKIPVDEGYLLTHVSNNHWIPATENVRRAIARLDEGEVLEASGFLVRAEREGGGDWTSSLTRGDSGDGSCELMYVERLRVGARVYE